MDFHEYVRFSKTDGEYQEQFYPLEKSAIVFLDQPKKNPCNIRRIFMEHLGNIIWEYSPEFHGEPFSNIPGIYHGNVSRISYEHIFAQYVIIQQTLIIKIL